MAEDTRRSLTIAVDGPSSSGKGTVARNVAQALGYQYVDTGAMYRAVALVAQRRGVAWSDEAGVAGLARALSFRFEWTGDVLRVLVDGDDITSEIRGEGIGRGASDVSKLPAVRQALLGLQRRLGAAGGVVMDGRDIGTVVLPEAGLKVYLDADLEERALRRHEELARKGTPMSYADTLEALRSRDAQDMNRDIAPLEQADDAILVDTTDLTPRQAIDRVLALARERGA